jgi:NADH-quinone oxidoreductase subunit L
MARCRRDGHPAGTAGARIVLTHLIGDAAMLLGLFIVARFTGRLDLDSLLSKAPELATISWMISGLSLLDLLVILLFLGMAAKAALFPLHGWLVETTETAPSGVALIQTVVLPLPAFLLMLRLEPLLASAPAAQEIILGLAVFTAFIASIVALTQTDLVKAVSWLTMSRLGLIMAGFTVRATAGVAVLLVNHLLFATILFLAAGLVLRALGGISEIRSMGGLWRRLPFLISAFLLGAIGFLGLPPTPGFQSVVFIVGAVFKISPVAAIILIGTAFVTTLALTRVMMTVFAGDERFDRQVSSGIRETPGMIFVSIIMMALGAYVIGHLDLASPNAPDRPMMMSIPLAAAVLTGLLIGVIRYRRRTPHSTPWKEFIRSGFGWPLVERCLIAIPFGAVAVWSRDVVDRVAISSVAEGLGHFSRGLGESMIPLRSLRLSTALTILVFVAAVLVWSLVR